MIFETRTTRKGALYAGNAGNTLKHSIISTCKSSVFIKRSIQRTNILLARVGMTRTMSKLPLQSLSKSRKIMHRHPRMQQLLFILIVQILARARITIIQVNRPSRLQKIQKELIRKEKTSQLKIRTNGRKKSKFLELYYSKYLYFPIY